MQNTNTDILRGRSKMIKTCREYRNFPMFVGGASLIVSVVLLAGCRDADPVHVYILPSEYRVGDVTSALATPVVDEVVRLDPKTVQVSSCLSTPPAKVLQFNIELRARLDTDIRGGFFEKCPES